MPAPLPTETSGSTRRADIQGLRAIAVLMVVAFHANLPVPGGFVGVDVFFVISGFVITALLMRENLAAGRIRFRQFYLRRFVRLTPALALTVGVTMVVSAVLLSPLGPQETAAKTGIGAMLLVANLVISRITGGYFDSAAEANPLLNTWTLSVEEQFYLVFPALLVLAWVLVRRGLRFAPLVIVGLVAAVSFVLALLNASDVFFRGSDLVLGFYSPFPRAWEFAVGALLALAGSRIASRNMATVLGLLGAAMLLASLWVISDQTAFPGPWTLLPVVGTLFLLVAGTRSDNVASRALSTRPLVMIGDWSYSIYLWHWPLIVFALVIWPTAPAVAVIAAVVSFAPAIASYRWLEQPIRRVRGRSRKQTVRLVALTLAIPLALAGGLLVAVGQGFWSSSVQAQKAALAPFHAAQTSGCSGTVPQSARPAGACVWGAAYSGTPIYLVGDSTADHFSEAIIAAGEQLERPVNISTTNACPFIDASYSNAAADPHINQQCQDYVRGTEAYLAEAPEGLVIISSSDGYWSDSGATVDSGDLASGLTATVDRLEASGQRVLIVQSAPRWTGENEWSPAACTLIAVMSGDCKATMQVNRIDSRQVDVHDAISRIAESTGSALLDTWSLLCPDGLCETQVPGLFRYRDQTHITVDQSRALASPFADAIQAAG